MTSLVMVIMIEMVFVLKFGDGDDNTIILLFHVAMILVENK
jgi:hypothetical protein